MAMQTNSTKKYCSLAAQRYARALYELKIPGEAVRETRKIFSENPLLGRAFESPAVSRDEKFRLIERIFPAQIRNFLKTACRHHRLDIIEEIFDAYEAYRKEQERTVSAVLSCLEPPAEEQLKRMETFLCGRYSAKRAEIQVRRDESLLGGFILRAGDDEYDWSLKGRLDRLKQKLTWR